MNFVPDPNKAVAEMRRVTRPQGTVSACVWDYDAGMQMLRFFWDEAVALDPAIEAKDERHMKLSRQGELGDLWEGWTHQRQGGASGDRPAYSSFNDYSEPFTKGRAPGARSSCRFRRVVANSSNLVCASACLEIARMARSRLKRELGACAGTFPILSDVRVASKNAISSEHERRMTSASHPIADISLRRN